MTKLKGKPCGASHISRSKKCHLGAASPPTGGAVAAGAVIAAGGAAAGAALLIARRPRLPGWSPLDEQQFRQAQAAGLTWKAYDRKLAADRRSPEVVRLRRERTRARRALCGSARGDAALRRDAYRDCSFQIGETSAFGKVIRHPSESFVFKVPSGNNSYGITKAKAERAAHNEALNMELAHNVGVPVPELLAFNPKTKVIKMEYLKDYVSLREAVGGNTRREIKNWTSTYRREVRMNLFRASFKMHSKLIGHADLHMGNIMVNPKGDVRFIDFGIARSRAINKDPSAYLAAIDRDLGSVVRNTAYFTGLDENNAMMFSRWMRLRHKSFLTSLERMWVGREKPDDNFVERNLTKYYLDLNRLANYVENNGITTLGGTPPSL